MLFSTSRERSLKNKLLDLGAGVDFVSPAGRTLPLIDLVHCGKSGSESVSCKAVSHAQPPKRAGANNVAIRNKDRKWGVLRMVILDSG